MTIPMPEPIYEIGDYPSNGEVMCDCYSLEHLEAYADARARQALSDLLNTLETRKFDGGQRQIVEHIRAQLPGPVEP